jgi:DNA repair exonuclease SbcCD ATPase subunit/DNA repair exonuclease SbcCD nuclease subunit
MAAHHLSRVRGKRHPLRAAANTRKRRTGLIGKPGRATTPSIIPHKETESIMKIAIMADLQPKGERLDEFRRQLDAAIDVAIANGCPVLAIAGDVWEVGNIGDSQRPTGAILRAVCEPLRRFLLAHKGNEIVCVRGNHDTDNDGLDDGLVALEMMDRQHVTIIREPGWHFIGGLSVAGLPWRWNGDDPDTPPDAEAELERLLDNPCTYPIEPPHPRLLLGHVQVLGAKYNSLRVCEGGTWIVSQEKLRELVTRYKIDRVALGDFHLRDVDLAGLGMGGFIGNLWQQNFSHVGNPQGLEVWDTETGEVVWHEVECARKHEIYTVSKADEVVAVSRILARRDDVRAWIKTDGFDLDRASKREIEALGIRVSAINVERVERVARLEGADKLALTDDRALLDGYVATRKIVLAEGERGRIDAALDDLIAANPKLGRGEKGDRVGAITPLRTRICGIGRHVDTEIVWEGLPDLVAVHGSNGAGKTTAVGALYTALYNSVPGYSGNMYDNLMAQGDGCALVECDFEVGGKRYRVRREVIGGNTKNPEQERWLYDLDTMVAIAGPKDADFRAAVERLVGDESTALATWFMTAGRDGDLTEIAPSERRALFGRMLGLERLDAVSDAAGEVAKELRARAKQAEASMPSIDDTQRALTEAEADLVGVVESQDVASVKVSDARKVRDAAAGEVERLKAGDEGHEAVVRDHDRLVAEVKSAEHEIQVANAEIVRLGEQASGLERACEAREALVAARTDLREMDIQKAAFDRWAEWQRERARLVADINSKKAIVDSLEQATGVNDETRALALQLDALVSEYHRLDDLNKALESDSKAWQQREREIDRVVDQWTRQVEHLNERIAAAPKGLFAEKCSPCPLLQESSALPGKLAEAERALSEAKAQAEAHADKNPYLARSVADLAPIIKKGEAARAAKKAVEQARATEARRELAIVELHGAEKALTVHDRKEPPSSLDPGPKLAALRERVENLVNVAAGEQSARTALDMLKARRESYERLRARLVSARGELEAIVPKYELAIAALNAREDAMARANLALLGAETALVAAQRELDAANTAFGTAQARCEEKRVRWEEAVAMRVRYEDLLAELKAREFIKTAFGREGVQPLLVEVAVPELEDVVTGLLSEAFERDVALAIRTQSETRKGDLVEDFRIEIADENGARDISRFSGGEREIFSLLLRIAVGLWLARRRGASLESVFVDEAFNKLDPGKTSRVVEILGRVARHFKRIVLLTPKGDVAAHFPARIQVSAAFDGSVISYIGCSPAGRQVMPVLERGEEELAGV